jgi:predicted NUDIX family phosphoesterase
MRWVERSLAEKDPSYKQIIPYIIVQNSAGQFLCYPRHGAEERLHGYYSCGIGGHIDEVDKRESFAETVRVGMTRELSEEISNFAPELVELSFKGIINETESEVGQVHLGVVYLARCRGAYLPLPSEETGGMEWKTAEELASLEKELWSDLALGLL